MASKDKNWDSRFLMLALFATGVSGIVSEYVLATLATYFLGNSVLQWTMILSIMLFSMGLGSRISRYFEKNILEVFIAIEFILTICASFCALSVYGLMGVTKYIEVIIYAFSIFIGLMIGMEIPLVTRLNGRYENLKFNIANVMEKDYYGSLLGGVFFAFVGLPYLGLTYTPFVLGSVNLIVAIALLFRFNKVIAPEFKKYLNLSALGVVSFMVMGVYFANPIIQFGEQSRYEHKVVFSKQTKFQKITMTQWKNNHVLYLNNSMQLNTMDEWLYHEPLVHPVMLLQGHPVNVLILGGGDGCGIREVLKYPSVKSIKIVDLDPDMTDFGANNPVFKSLNDYAYQSELVEVINQDAFIYLENDTNFYDVIIIDFPDPRSIELGRLYTKELYHFCYNKLSRNGLIVTQATSPYFQTKAFRCIEKTIGSVGFNTLPIHNHVQSFGEWGWIIGSKYLNSEDLKKQLQNAKISDIRTRWLNQESLSMMTLFGKDISDAKNVEVNTIHNPVLFKYYIKGTEFNQNFYD